MGIIHANHGSGILPFLLRSLNNASGKIFDFDLRVDFLGNEIVQHGACLGLGLAGMASGNDEVYETLKNIMFMDSAVAGEAAGLAMGLVMLGSASKKGKEKFF